MPFAFQLLAVLTSVTLFTVCVRVAAEHETGQWSNACVTQQAPCGSSAPAVCMGCGAPREKRQSIAPAALAKHTELKGATRKCHEVTQAEAKPQICSASVGLDPKGR